VLDEGEWSASHPSHFTPGESALSTHWIGWVSLRAVLDMVVKRKIPSTCQESNSRNLINIVILENVPGKSLERANANLAQKII
jgi:hypothetical protein